jgi:hypothetical protein
MKQKNPSLLIPGSFIRQRKLSQLTDMKKILVVDDESGIDLTVKFNDGRNVYRHVCDILIQRVSMHSPHDHILINIKDQLKDYIDKCLTAQELT